MRIRALAFPLTLALLLGGLTAWLGRISEVSVEEVRLNPKEPQYLMEKMSGKRFDENGLLKESLSAVSAWQLPDREDVYFKQPDLELFARGSLQYSVNSEQARYNLEERRIYFDRGVHLQKTADSARPAGEMQTEQLTVDTVSQNAVTQSPVKFRYGSSQGSAVGMTYDHQNGRLTLPSKVRALIYATPD